jgi:hypothetical protein
VTRVGQAFADEIYRVFALAHPEVTLETRNANDSVGMMIGRAIAARQAT